MGGLKITNSVYIKLLLKYKSWIIQVQSLTEGVSDRPSHRPMRHKGALAQASEQHCGLLAPRAKIAG
ncbi:hypothetical protein CEXT_92091, partial [Caerostris extrusa]